MYFLQSQTQTQIVLHGTDIFLFLLGINKFCAKGEKDLGIESRAPRKMQA
jgi:hypothetical protein